MISQRLKQMRLARGLSLESLAAELGGVVTKQALSKYEQGKMQPSPKVLNRLAAVLGVKAAYLYEEPDIDIQFIAYRKVSKLLKHEQQQIEGIVRLNLEKRIHLQALTHPDSRVDLPVLEIPIKTVEDAESAALQLRSLWNLGIDPISSVTAILEEHFIHVLEVNAEDSFDGISAVAYDNDQGILAAAVVTRSGVSGERERLNLAHELGHLVLKVPEYVDEEKAAFRFGAAFLAPMELVHQEVGSKRTSIELAELLLLKRRFGLSIQALLYRLRDLGIITKSYHQTWCIEINRRKWKKQEPEELPVERPQWLRQNVLRALSEHLLTLEQAEQLLQEQISVEQPLPLVERRAFMKLPLTERNRILEEQAEKMADYYEEDTEWRDLQGGDFIDY